MVPLEGNAKSLASLAIRIGDAAKWLADQWRQHNREEFQRYAEVKKRLKIRMEGEGLVLSLRGGPAFSPFTPKAQAPQSNCPPLDPKEGIFPPDVLARLIAKMRNPDTGAEGRKRSAEFILRDLQERQNVQPLVEAGIDAASTIAEAEAILEENPESFSCSKTDALS